MNVYAFEICNVSFGWVPSDVCIDRTVLCHILQVECIDSSADDCQFGMGA